LKEYVEYVESSPFGFEMTPYPESRAFDLKFPKSSAKQSIDRPIHFYKYLPNMFLNDVVRLSDSEKENLENSVELKINRKFSAEAENTFLAKQINPLPATYGADDLVLENLSRRGLKSSLFCSAAEGVKAASQPIDVFGNNICTFLILSKLTFQLLL